MSAGAVVSLNRGWHHTIEVWDILGPSAPDRDLESKAAILSARIRAYKGYSRLTDREGLEELLDEFVTVAAEDDEAAAEYVLHEIYDWADAERVWLNPFKP